MALSDDARGVAQDARYITGLLGSAVEQLGKLVDNEMQLAKAEMSQKLGRAAMGAAYLVGAAVLLIPVLVMLLMTLAIWLHTSGWFSEVTSYLIATGVGVLLSLILGLLGKSYLSAEQLKPKVTLGQIERDIQAAKELAK
jgi:hypothetical protein